MSFHRFASQRRFLHRRTESCSTPPDGDRIPREPPSGSPFGSPAPVRSFLPQHTSGEPLLLSVWLPESGACVLSGGYAEIFHRTLKQSAPGATFLFRGHPSVRSGGFVVFPPSMPQGRLEYLLMHPALGYLLGASSIISRREQVAVQTKHTMHLGFERRKPEKEHDEQKTLSNLVILCLLVELTPLACGVRP